MSIHLKAPWVDLLNLADRLTHARVMTLGLLGLVLAWWIYVPVHELLHVAGCLLGGGEVSRLELSPWYGGGLLEQVFPFVYSGSEYAGQLTGFDTGGSDATYLLTVLLPYILSIFPGIWWLRSNQVFCAGAGLPLAFAPFISVFGDMYEAGSILVTDQGSALRSDDVLLLITELWPPDTSDALTMGAAWGTGLILALGCYALGSLLAQRLGRPPQLTSGPTP